MAKFVHPENVEMPTYYCEWGYEQQKAARAALRKWLIEHDDIHESDLSADALLEAVWNAVRGDGLLDANRHERVRASARSRPRTGTTTSLRLLARPVLEEVCRAMALADSRKLIVETSDETQLGHASDSGWREYSHMAEAIAPFLSAQPQQ